MLQDNFHFYDSEIDLAPDGSWKTTRWAEFCKCGNNMHCEFNGHVACVKEGKFYVDHKLILGEIKDCIIFSTCYATYADSTYIFYRYNTDEVIYTLKAINATAVSGDLFTYDNNILDTRTFISVSKKYYMKYYDKNLSAKQTGLIINITSYLDYDDLEDLPKIVVSVENLIILTNYKWIYIIDDRHYGTPAQIITEFEIISGKKYTLKQSVCDSGLMFQIDTLEL